MTQQPFPDGDAPGALLRDYILKPGASDELLDGAGNIRPVWLPLNPLSRGPRPRSVAPGLSARAISTCAMRASISAITKRGAASERDWPLSHIPVLIDETEFAKISAGLIERADMLEWLAADLYGDNSLVNVGHLPAELVAGNPEWLRPLVGIAPPSGHYLDFIAFEIGRGPDGQWWVLSDRTDTPAGAGFAIENRVATTRVFSETALTGNVLKLAPFFRAFRDRLYGMRQDRTRRIGLLSSGPDTETYFEHAYIARYLGMLLLEGEDLATGGRATDAAHRRGPAPDRCAVAQARRRRGRSAGAGWRVAIGGSRPAGGRAARACHHRQRDGDRHPAKPRLPRLSAQPVPAAAQAGACRCPMSRPGGAETPPPAPGCCRTPRA